MFSIKSIVKFILNLKKDLDFLNDIKKIKKFSSKNKNSIDPVTKLDLKVEKLIRSKITKNFSTHSIIGEEFNDKIKNSDYKWVLDPIDGTKNLIMGLPTWSNLIGLYKGKNSILSFANFPVLRKYYIAYSNKTFVNQKNFNTRIYSNKKANYKNAKVAINTFHTIKEKKIFKFLKRYKGLYKITGSDAYNFCSIAEGKIDVLIESGLKKVDIFPLISIIRNSGAIITDWQGKNEFNKGDVLVTANKKLHKKFLKIIN
ncbi:MAG: inositol monophosphatase [Spirochaetales bacterium]|mgnify:CR=1 FL=1|jgi:myo-inositol-1(or 4)-monophosphatase|nr:inositol monophosphatase [Spirochaetales bacterium]|tara:strand:+ start:163 stop:933 length:771 start_codon:yes stop_codon:yes gene_type:complete